MCNGDNGTKKKRKFFIIKETILSRAIYLELIFFLKKIGNRYSYSKPTLVNQRRNNTTTEIN